MKAYKGFNQDLTCRGFQYEEGKTHETDKAKLCEEGFHACENPIDCLRHYSPAQSVYHDVELDGVSDEREDGDTKIVGKRITVGAKIGIPQICQLTFEFVKSHCTNEHNAEATEELQRQAAAELQHQKDRHRSVRMVSQLHVAMDAR